MDFNCPKCTLAGRIDDAKLPEQGINAVCPKCGERFLVKREPPKTVSPPDDFTFDVLPAAPRDAGYTAAENPDRSPRIERPSAGRSPRPAASAADGDDLRTFIGKNADKYLGKFASFGAEGNGGFAVTWHWPAFLVPFWWLIYRKQYMWALIAFLVSFIPWVNLLSMVGFGIAGNYIYYSYVRKKLNEINANPSEMGRAVEMARAGGVNNIALVLVPFIGIAMLGIIAAIAIPQYASYRAKSANAAAIAELRKAETCVDTYYAEHHAYPDSLEQANYTKMQDIDVHFNDIAADKYTLVAAHRKGDREFEAKSDETGLLYRSTREKDSEFVPLK